MTGTEIPEAVSTELTNQPVTNPAGVGFTNPQGFVLAGMGFKTGGTDQGLRSIIPGKDWGILQSAASNVTKLDLFSMETDMGVLDFQTQI